MKTYKIHLIRHGLEKPEGVIRYVGKTDLPLTARGKEQIKVLDNQGIYPYAQRLYSSPLKRCVETLEIIYPEKEITTVPGLCECDFGKFENKTAEELKDDPAFSDWLSGGCPPGGESTDDFVKRSVVAFAKTVEDIMKEGVTDCAFCLHGGNIMAILSVCGLPELPFNEWVCAPGRGYTLRITPSVWMRGYKAEVLGEI